MSSSTIHRNRSGFAQRAAFTLTELLIGITIIGLLVGMLAVAGTGAIGSAREFAVVSEITQMEQAIESFKTEYGFYPPSFEQFKRQTETGVSSLPFVHDEALQILPFLNKIAPNHREMDAAPTGVAGRTRLDDWWENVGCHLDQTTGLQFWLSGMSQNKQFPLTGGLPLTGGVYMPVGYNEAIFVNHDPEGADGTPNVSEIPNGYDRKVFYDFQNDQLQKVLVNNGGTATFPVASYNMPYGKTNGDLFFVYRDSNSYLPVIQPGAPNSNTPGDIIKFPHPTGTPTFAQYITNPLHRGPAYYFVNTGGTPEFANPNTFQIITFGLDGDPGVSPTATPDGQRGLMFDKAAGVQEVQLPKSADNLCNFANGRLDKYITEQQ